MKIARLTTVLLIGLAIMCNGCSALMPPTADNFRAQNEYEQVKNDSPQAGQPDGLWELLYCALTLGGESLANK
jgi:hypothetical protein